MKLITYTLTFGQAQDVIDTTGMWQDGWILQMHDHTQLLRTNGVRITHYAKTSTLLIQGCHANMAPLLQAMDQHAIPRKTKKTQ